MRAVAAPLALAALAALAAPAGAQDRWLVVVSGLGGEPEYRDAFHEWGATLVGAARDRLGVPAERVRWLAEDPARQPGIHARSTRDNVEATLTEVAGASGPDDVIFVVVFGHGSHDGGSARVNLPGPDPTAEDFAGMLEGLPGRVAFVNTASASGAFLPAVAAPGRAVVTATRSGVERNHALFGGFLAEAYAGDGADSDKDGRVSLLEAFVFASARVADTYERDRRLRTEHALLDDDGDGEGSLEPGSDGAADGALAATLFLGADAMAVAAEETDDPELRRLLEERGRLGARLESLRGRKDAMDPAQYERELEALLLEIARTDRAIRERREGGS